MDRGPDDLKRCAENPRDFVATWEQSIGPRLNTAEMSTVHGFAEAERGAPIAHHYVAQFEMGAHFFLNLTIFIGIFDRPYMAGTGPLSSRHQFAARLAQ